MNYLVDFEALAWHSPMPGVREKRHRVEGRVLRLVEYAQSMAPHWCSKGHIGQILEGVLELEFVDRIVSAKAGDGLFIPAGAEHAHRAVAKTTTVVALFVEDDV